MNKLLEDSFTWSRWRAFNLFDNCWYLKNYKPIFKKYAIGYIDAERLKCRPKINNYAVMFLKDGIFSWVHMNKKEFNLIWMIK